jgi:hypothetical protein
MFWFVIGHLLEIYARRQARRQNKAETNQKQPEQTRNIDAPMHTAPHVVTAWLLWFLLVMAIVFYMSTTQRPGYPSWWVLFHAVVAK